MESHTAPHGRWTEKGGIIYFEVVRIEHTELDFMRSLENFRPLFYSVGSDAVHMIRSRGFPAYLPDRIKVAALRSELFEDGSRTTCHIQAYGKKRHLAVPHSHLAFTILNNFTAVGINAMGLNRIIVMHEPIKDRWGSPCVLAVCPDGNGDPGLMGYEAGPSIRWQRGGGFAFVVPQVSSDP